MSLTKNVKNYKNCKKDENMFFLEFNYKKVHGNSKWQHKIMTLYLKIRLRQNQAALKDKILKDVEKDIENPFTESLRLF